MGIPYLGSRVFILLFILVLCDFASVQAQSSSDDASVMQELKKNLNPPSSLGWSDPDPCKWKSVVCSNGNRVNRIQIGGQGLTGTLPPSLSKLSELQRFEVMRNELSGPIPSLAGLSNLQYLLLSNNKFTSFPSDFFTGMNQLLEVYLDYNLFTPWPIPESLRNATSLQVFSATQASINGTIPDFLGTDLSGLTTLHLAFNFLEGELPATFAGSQIQSLWLNGQKSNPRLTGSISVIQNMTQLTEVWLHSNSFTGPLPDFSNFIGLQNFSIRDNSITGLVPDSLVKIPTLKVLNLTNNKLQGPTPKFAPSVAVDMIPGRNSFCLSDPGVPCHPRVNWLLEIAGAMGYPTRFAENWEGNDPCASWQGVVCSNGNITTINFPNMGLTGTISPSFASITSLQNIILSNNNLSGTIPDQLANLPNLQKLDISNNGIKGTIPPKFRSDVRVITAGNPDFGKLLPPPAPPRENPGSPPGDDPRRNPTGNNPVAQGKKSTGVVVGSVIGGICAAVAVGIGLFCVCRAKQKNAARVQSPNAMVVHPRHSGSDQDAVKITISNSGVNGGTSETHSHVSSNGHSDLHVIESGSMVISIQVLKSVTNNFAAENILGRGGFGTVYKGELHDGTKIAVKRMESGVLTDKGLDEFMSEIAVLTKVRHRHLVALLGYCLDGNERLLVYEYMPQGTLSRFLFDWKIEGLKPLEWSKRLIVALDVARAVEYLHGLAHQSFIHRDLKPSNILLGDDMRAKVADFGLVRLAPDGKASLVTKLAGTFGYLAPEYAVTGRVTTKIDVFSFGVILMELITGRKALYDTEQEESVHLVTWFRKMNIDKETLQKAFDPTIELNEETLSSITTVAELAGHCCAREPSQRPDMGHVVNVLSSLTELWKPSKPDTEDMYGIDFDMSLPQALKKWQALEGMSGIEDSTSGSSFLTSSDNTQTSIPTRPSGFADSFTSADGR